MIKKLLALITAFLIALPTPTLASGFLDSYEEVVVTIFYPGATKEKMKKSYLVRRSRIFTAGDFSDRESHITRIKFDCKNYDAKVYLIGGTILIEPKPIANFDPDNITDCRR